MAEKLLITCASGVFFKVSLSFRLSNIHISVLAKLIPLVIYAFMYYSIFISSVWNRQLETFCFFFSHVPTNYGGWGAGCFFSIGAAAYFHFCAQKFEETQILISIIFIPFGRFFWEAKVTKEIFWGEKALLKKVERFTFRTYKYLAIGWVEYLVFCFLGFAVDTRSIGDLFLLD